MAITGKTTWKKIKNAGLGLFAGILLCELVLRIYNPFPVAVNKGKITLAANQHKIFSNKWIRKLDEKIHYSKNSLGFRGPEMPAAFPGFISIITIGGSTTECKFLSDSCTWPARLYEKLHDENPMVWLNNAGIDGHSTFGHLLLLKEYIVKIKPRYAIFMTGINDVELISPDEHDQMAERKINTHSAKAFLKSLLNYSALGSTFLNYYQLQVAYKKGLVHQEIDLRTLTDNPLPDSIVARRLAEQASYLKNYKERINDLIAQCKQAGITPILMTQPSLYGSYTDPATNVQVANKWFRKDITSDNCMLEGKILELYNDVLRSYADSVFVIDLSASMPKNSLYFYDFTHFTNAGAAKAAEIIDEKIRPAIFKPGGMK